MRNFLGTVKKATIAMGNEPYDYKSTEASLLEATRRTVEHHEKMKVDASIASLKKAINGGPVDDNSIRKCLQDILDIAKSKDSEYQSAERMIELLKNTETFSEKKKQRLAKVVG